jgi:hypothetical protein
MSRVRSARANTGQDAVVSLFFSVSMVLVYSYPIIYLSTDGAGHMNKELMR